ncbi:beta-lactamase/transpeptidase-like protein [Daldinia loculata]|uniref:beta-lactamase/transpeptidase-like protein n=1 Tax=Daldinia loculata TaxID=103429 RepID=UPI0020C3A99A|nr:beta-lactamase/transpeptidase-like protein [Daldinia loculata]KAI1642457.1 beta-lactamase/transpeptidase-like protein [Daldinia loculata]
MRLLRVSPLLAVLARDVLAAKNGYCPPLGPVLPAPTSPSSNPVVQQYAVALFDGTTVSIGVKSIHEATPLVDIHYQSPDLDPRGTKQTNASTVYRVGSVSKLFTVLAALKTEGVRMEDPITKYLPRLKELEKRERSTQDQLATVDWEDITLRALASHMSGIGPDLVTDMTSLEADWTKLGLPQARETLGCRGFQGVAPCNKEDFWENFGKRDPTFAPYTTPMYSNTAFYLLSLVIESKNILDPVGMTRTSLAKTDDKLGAIFPNYTTWDDILGIDDPAGGFYSSTEDLIAFGEAILTYKLLSPSQTRHKAGDLGSHHAMFSLIPDYDLVVSVLITGSRAGPGTTQIISSLVTQLLLPAIEDAGKEDALARFAGTYRDEQRDSSITLAVDDDGPGLGVAHWTVRGEDVRGHWLRYLTSPTDDTGGIYVSMRLYPSGLSTGSRTAWRAVARLAMPEQLAQMEALLFWPQGSCLTWALTDRAVYEFSALEEIVFNLVDTESGSNYLTYCRYPLE